MAEKSAEIAFSPGFRFGTTLLPGESITMEQLMNQMAITYPYVTVNDLSGDTIKAILEDVADNLFNPDPYYQQGGDMVRVGGLQYACDPGAKMGARISQLSLRGKPLEADRKYKVAGWAPVAEQARAAGGEPIWDVVARHLRAQKSIKAPTMEAPRLIGVAGNPGLA
jgi:sulfur-oxidizing protein SoxB